MHGRGDEHEGLGQQGRRDEFPGPGPRIEVVREHHGDVPVAVEHAGEHLVGLALVQQHIGTGTAFDDGGGGLGARRLIAPAHAVAEALFRVVESHSDFIHAVQGQH